MDDFRFTSLSSHRWTSGPYAWTHRHIEVWWTARPRSATSSCKSRSLKQKRRYQRTQVTITSGSNFRFQNNGGRHDLMAYATKSAAATLPIWAIAHRLCRLIWKVLHDKVRYIEKGTDLNPKAQKERKRRLVAELKRLGYKVELTALDPPP